MAPSAQQKQTLAAFLSLTGASEKQAARFLRQTSYNIEEALDAFYNSGLAPDNGPSPVDKELDRLFDSLRDPGKDEKDKMELESTMAYLTNGLKVSLENAQLLIVHELVQSPSIGEITRTGYVNGWRIPGVSTSNKAHADHIRQLSSNLASETALFRRVYKYTFVIGKEKDQKAMPLDTALTYWGVLFNPPGIVWETPNHNWLELWKQFLNEKWTRSVNRDMWNMALEFALKTLEDETLGFWNEDGAWPSVIDSFVEWCREKGIGKGQTMDVDA